ncbi:MAG: glycosyltransferase family 39 protein [Chloroflexi bacterium]|nr:glycosyltransferase family 39 protein [Chloroflexota bacterium]MBU1751180.1 glycosyltransferase family 39 protein [Chloroflexota bacterium]
MLAHAYFSSLPWTVSTPLMILDRLFDIGLALAILGLAAALGLWPLRLLRLTDLSALEELLFATGLGLGVLMYGVMALGIIGWLNSLAWIVVMVVLVGLALPQVSRAKALCTQAGQELREDARSSHVPLILLFPIAFILVFGLLQALAPLADYDGLVVHVEAPKQFIARGRFFPLPEISPANYPLNVEMLYAIGVLLGTDVFPKVLHFAFGLLSTLALYALGRRFFTVRSTWLGVVLFLVTPLACFSMQIAYVDLGLTFFVLLAEFALFRWWQGPDHGERRHLSWLAMCGAGCGIALGSKYTAAFTLLIIGGVVLARTVLWNWKSPRRILRDVLLWGSVAAVVAAPWYVRNWLWLGNPVYPAFFGGPEWPPSRVERFAYLLSLYGAGHDWQDYLLLPWNLLTDSGKFGTSLFAHSSVLLWIPLFAVLLVRHHRSVSLLLVLSYAQVVAWALFSQQSRLLLPVLGPLCLLTGVMLERLLERWRGPWGNRAVFYPIICYAMATIVLQQIFFWLDAKPLGVVLGLESRHSYLSRNLPDYNSMTYINEHTSETAKVLMIGDGCGYYLQRAYVSDASLETWSYIVSLAQARTPEAVYRVLREKGITHILVEDYAPEWLEQFDPHGTIRSDLLILQALQPQYLELIYKANPVHVYQLRP